MSDPKSQVGMKWPNCRQSHAFEPGESVWSEEIWRVMEMLVEHLEHLRENKNTAPPHDSSQQTLLPLQDRPDFVRLSIALHGTYGAGKSSLLKTLVYWLTMARTHRGGSWWTSQQWPIQPNGLQGDLLEKLDSHSQQIATLPVICASDLAIEEDFNFNFLYTVLATALQADQDRQHPQQRGGQQGLHQEPQFLTEVQQAFQEVSEYLQAMDTAPKDQKMDPLGVSLARLERHGSISWLKRALETFFHRLADTLASRGDGIVVLPIDDTDMDPTLLVSTFATYSTYLYHPRLIPIFTFTGRIAEELLRKHFRDKLGGKEGDDSPLFEVSTQIPIYASLANQYMGKLFPVRHRIRLSHASRRVRDARYREDNQNSGASNAGQDSWLEVKDLLRNATHLLFGIPESPPQPEVPLALRSAALRRQLQLIDAMTAAGIRAAGPDPKIPFGMMYDRATWGVLNAHRDILKEYQLDLDDLYSWPSDGLRQVITVRVMRLQRAKRRELLEHWLYRTADRRSQVFSLLAANVFRPSMYGDASIADGPRPTVDDTEAPQSFSVRKGVLWFLRVWLGFYLPQILGRDRPDAKQDAPLSEGITGIGWSLESASLHAIRVARENKHTLFTGMLLLDPGKFAESVRAESEVSSDTRWSWGRIMPSIWCYHGSDRGKPWAAVSFWRGLGLVGQLLEADITFLSNHWNKSKYEGTPEESYKKCVECNRAARVEIIRQVLWVHIRTGAVSGTPSEGGETGAAGHEFEPPVWKVEQSIHALADAIIEWLNCYNPVAWRIQPLGSPDSVPDRAQRSYPDRTQWKSCFMRMMHGDNLLHFYWQRIRRLESLANEWTALDLLWAGCEALVDYWDSGREPVSPGERSMDANLTLTMLMDCPFIAPFARPGRIELSRLRYLYRVVRGHLKGDEGQEVNHLQHVHKFLQGYRGRDMYNRYREQPFSRQSLLQDLENPEYDEVWSWFLLAEKQADTTEQDRELETEEAELKQSRENWILDFGSQRRDSLTELEETKDIRALLEIERAQKS